MADANILGPDCDDDGEGERGERGKRGHRGHRGHHGHDGNDGATGPTGPAGPAGLGTGGLLKFSGLAGEVASGDTTVTYLADGFNLGEIFSPTNYPVAVDRSLRNMATNLLDPTPIGETVTIELIKNLATVPVVVASITYGIFTVSSGIQTVAFTEPFAMGDTIDMRVTATGGNVETPTALAITATVGVE